MANNNWGKLVRAIGGSDSEIIPETIMLFDQKNFFGRVPNADANKFNHCQQFVIPLPYLSSTHFSIEMKATENDGEATYLLTDHSRNGTFFRHKQVSTATKEPKLEPLGASKSVIISSGDQIILMFRNEITVMYTFIKNVQPRLSKPEIAQPPLIIPKVPEPQPSSSNSPRKRSKDDRDASNDDRKLSNSVEGGSSARLLKKQVESLQQENKEQEQRVATVVAANTALAVDLNAKERDLRTCHATLAMKESELASATDSLRAVEANFAATEARVRILEDSSEVQY